VAFAPALVVFLQGGKYLAFELSYWRTTMGMEIAYARAVRWLASR